MAAYLSRYRSLLRKVPITAIHFSVKYKFSRAVWGRKLSKPECW